MKLGNILKNCSLLLLCSALCADFSMASNGSLQDENDAQTAQTGLLSLPEELLLGITLKLDKLKDVQSFVATCQTLRNISNYEVIWRKHSENLELGPLEDGSTLSYKAQVREHIPQLKHRSLQDVSAAILEVDVTKLSDILASLPVKVIKSMRCSLPFYSPSYSDDIREVLKQAGNLQAMEREACSLAGIGSFSPELLDTDEELHLKSLIEKLVEAGSLEGIRLKMMGLKFGKYGYGSGPFEDQPSPGPEMAKQFIAGLTAKGCKRARYMTIMDLFRRYKKNAEADKQDYEAAKRLIIELSREADSPAMPVWMFDSPNVYRIWYGLDEDANAAWQKVDEYAKAGDPVALKLKLEFLGKWEENDYLAALIKQGNQAARQLRASRDLKAHEAWAAAKQRTGFSLEQLESLEKEIEDEMSH